MSEPLNGEIAHLEAYIDKAEDGYVRFPKPLAEGILDSLRAARTSTAEPVAWPEQAPIEVAYRLRDHLHKWPGPHNLGDAQRFADEVWRAAAKFAAPPQPAVTVTPLVWSEVMPPDAECSYTHCHAETPFGRIVLDWKGWKERPSFSAVLGNEFIDAAIAASTVEDAQRMIGEWWQEKVRAALASIPQGEGSQ